jgi:hypothetical protein
MPDRNCVIIHRARLASLAVAGTLVVLATATGSQARAQSQPQLDLSPPMTAPGQKPPRTGREFGTDWANPRNVWRAPPRYRDPSSIETDRGCVDVGPGMPVPRGRKRCR